MFEQYLSVVGRGVRAFLSLEAGVTRADAAPPGPLRGELERQLREARGELESRDQQLEEARRQLEGKDLELTSKDQGLAELRARLLRGGTETGGVEPEKVVWIFGSGRSGSTWLSSMMGEIEGHTLWGEPWVGALFGNYYYSAVNKRGRTNPQFILGRHKDSWLRSIRYFVLDAAAATFRDLSEDDYLIIKEPNGSIGAPLMMEALPESRMILLARDPRDVIASSMDARREGGWNYERHKKLYQERRRMPSSKNPDRFVERQAKNYVRQMGKAKEAYDAHGGPKVLVRY